MIKKLIKKIETYISDLYYLWLWSIYKGNGINKDLRNPQIIVSLTSFPGRIQIVHKTIRTLLIQKNVKPDKIELWLASEQFGDKKLPSEIIELENYGLSICWTSDIRSYKKLIPSLLANNNDIIVTCDDDVYYKRDWLQKLYVSYQKHPMDIQCHRATMIYLANNEWNSKGGGKFFYKGASFLNKLVGIGGVLYPPHSLHPDAVNIRLFMKIAPTNDDIWFWLMAVRNNRKIRVVDGNYHRPVDVLGSEITPKLNHINDHGQKLFWEQFYNILERYPEIVEFLKNNDAK